MENNAVSNTGPIIHLSEIDFLKTLNIFSHISIPEEVFNELRRSHILVPRKIKIISLKPEFKDVVKILINQKELDIGESCAIALVMQEKAKYFLTDDLDARNVAKEYGIEVHGSVGILLRAFRDKIIDKKNAIESVRLLHTKSSLFITSDLIEQIVGEIENFS